MSFATFWIEDNFTKILSLPGFTTTPALDWHELAEINNLSDAEVIDRRNNEHHPYIARMYGQPVAYGWLATSKMSIGELDINVELPSDDRYLWDLPLFRIGRVVGFIRVCYSPSLNRKSKTLKGFGSSTRQKIFLPALA
jgi:hypothetical protein